MQLYPKEAEVGCNDESRVPLEGTSLMSVHQSQLQLVPDSLCSLCLHGSKALTGTSANSASLSTQKGSIDVHLSCAAMRYLAAKEDESFLSGTAVC